MMKPQSLDFIVGYLFSRMDKYIFEHFNANQCEEALVVSINIPKIWFGLTSSHDITNDLKGFQKYAIRVAICETLTDMYPKLESCCGKIVADNQYIRFDFEVKYKEVVKKMTITEIESILGHKIEIIGDR